MKTNIKIFLVTLLLQFMMSVLLHQNFQLPTSFDFLKIKSFQLTSPTTNAAAVENPALTLIRQKLQGVSDNFQVKSSGKNLLNEAVAASDYDSASSYLVVDFDSGEVLLEKDSNKKLSIASLTKIMTAIVTSDLTSQEDLFSVSKAAVNIEPTSIGVVEGQKMKVSELLQAMLMTSANDAAEVLKEGVDQKYSGEYFIEAMNEKAKIIGAKNSHFENPQGFDGTTHYSTASDLALITHYALTHYPDLAEIVKKSYQFLPEDTNHKQFDLYNWNGLLEVYPGAIGVKIGNTDEAGKTTTVLAEREGKKVLVVLLGAPGVLERDLWTAQLLDLGFEKVANLKPIAITEQDLRDKYSTWKFWN